MKQITIAILLITSFGGFAQNVTSEEFKKEIKPLNSRIKLLQLENALLKNEITILKSSISRLDSLQKQAELNSSALTKASAQLGIEIQQTSKSSDAKISAVDKSLSKNSLYGIIGVLAATLLSGLLYWIVIKRQKTDKSDFIDQLSKTKSSIEESLVKEFGKQTELMDSQLHLIEQQNATSRVMPTAEPDHSLALKVASEINLIERNINLMDAKTKGLKQLQASVGKLKDNLSANGYEMPELLGKQFHQGMKVIVTSSIPDENLEKKSEIISKVLIPQVNYNDKMIQTAQIEVSVGY